MVHTRSRGVSEAEQIVSPLILKPSPGRTTCLIKKRGSASKRDGKENVAKKMNRDRSSLESHSDIETTPEKKIKMRGREKIKSDRSTEEQTSPLAGCCSSSNSDDSPLVSPVVPLKGREKEFGEMVGLIEESIRSATPLTVYISGTPGTGKTATTELVLRDLKQRLGIQTALLNCTRLRTAAEVCGAAVDLLGCSRGNSSSSTLLRQTVSALSAPLVFVLDEADFVSPPALASLFSMPYTVSAHLMVIGIANTIDFTERLQKKMKLRCEPRLLVFGKYSQQELSHILRSRMNEENLEGGAVEMCARKVSAVSGDVRTALALARESGKRVGRVREAESERLPVALRAVGDCLKEAYSSPLSRARLPRQPRLLLAVCLSLTSTSRSVPSVKLRKKDLVAAYNKACLSLQWPCAQGEDLENALDMLQAQSFLSCERDLIHLQVDVDTAKSAIVDNDIISQVERLRL